MRVVVLRRARLIVKLSPGLLTWMEQQRTGPYWVCVIVPVGSERSVLDLSAFSVCVSVCVALLVDKPVLRWFTVAFRPPPGELCVCETGPVGV